MRNKVIDLLDQTIEELDKEKIDGILEIPPKDDMGDFAFPCFQLAKVFRKYDRNRDCRKDSCK